MSVQSVFALAAAGLLVTGALVGAAAQGAPGQWGFCGAAVRPPAARALELAGSNPAALRCVVSQYPGTRPAQIAQQRLDELARREPPRPRVEAAGAPSRPPARQASRAQQDRRARAPRTVTVSREGNADYRDLRQAIAAVPAGSTVIVYPWEYTGPFVLDKSITLRAAPGPIQPVLTSASEDETLIIEDQSRPVVEGVEIRNTGFGNAVKIWGSSSPVFRRVRIQTREISSDDRDKNPDIDKYVNQIGIDVRSGAPVVENSSFRTPSGPAMLFQFNASGIVRRSDVRISEYAFFLSGSANPRIEMNIIEGSKRSAIFIVGQARGDFVQNQMRENSQVSGDNGGRSATIVLQDSANPTFKQTNIEKPFGPAIQVADTAGGRFEDTRLESGSGFHPVYVYANASPVFRGTTIVNWPTSTPFWRENGAPKADIEAPTILPAPSPQR